MYGNYFFLHHNIEEYNYEAYNFFGLASDLGGLIEFLYILFSLFPLYYYNKKVTQQKFIEKLYFVETNQSDIENKDTSSHRLNSIDLESKTLLPEKKKEIIDEAQAMINDELNLFNHMQQIRKLKAGMCELIGDDSAKL